MSLLDVVLVLFSYLSQHSWCFQLGRFHCEWQHSKYWLHLQGRSFSHSCHVHEVCRWDHSRASPAAVSTRDKGLSVVTLPFLYRQLPPYGPLWWLDQSLLQSANREESGGRARPHLLRLASLFQDISWYNIQWCAWASWYQLVRAVALPNSVFSAVRVEAWNYPWWDDLHHGNWQTLQTRASLITLLPPKENWLLNIC